MRVIIDYYNPETKEKKQHSMFIKSLTPSVMYDAIYDFADDDRLGCYILKMEVKKD